MRSKIAVFYGAGKPLQLEECEIPALCQGEVLVKNEYVTLCRSDISTYTGKRIEKTPTILGHEIVGRVVALGEGNPVLDLEGRPLAIGERVTWAIYASNPDGEMARRGIPQKAPDLFKYGHEQLTERNTLHGGLAEYTLLRRYTPVLPLWTRMSCCSRLLRAICPSCWVRWHGGSALHILLIKCVVSSTCAAFGY